MILQKHNDLSTLQALFDKSSLGGGCPNLVAQKLGSNMAVNYQKTPKTSLWYTIMYLKTGELMTNFTICPSCTAKLEVLLRQYAHWTPSLELRNVFVLASHVPCEATCDFISGDRMLKYIACALESMSGDFSLLAALITERAHLPECREGLTLYGKYFTLKDANCFTACEECMQDVIKPDIERGAVSYESLESHNAAETGFVYSLKVPRVQKLWTTAMISGPEGFYSSKTRKHGGNWLMAEIQELFTKIQMLLIQAKGLEQLAFLQQSMEGRRMLTAKMIRVFTCLPNYSRVNALVAQAGQIRLQTISIKGELSLLLSKIKKFGFNTLQWREFKEELNKL